jgi:hypothetical protein
LLELLFSSKVVGASVGAALSSTFGSELGKLE